MHQYRICKYDPRQRGSGGIYLRHEWVDVSQLGQSFYDGEFTREKYLDVEQAYIDAALAFVSRMNLSELFVNRLELDVSEPTGTDPWLVTYALDDCNELARVVTEGQAVPAHLISAYLKCVLRGIFWCSFESPGRLYIEIGYDYYMYVGVANECPEAVDFTRMAGLDIRPLSPKDGRFRQVCVVED